VAARLVNSPLAETTIMRDLVADGIDRHHGKEVLAAHSQVRFDTRHQFLGNADQCTVDGGLAS
jgi:hypothetical protein